MQYSNEATNQRVVHPEDIERIREERRNALLGNKPFAFEERIRREGWTVPVVSRAVQSVAGRARAG